jgi:hypothetical protein
VTANGLYTVRINATDKAGNKAYAGPTSITGDVTAPGITLTSVLPNPSNGLTTITVTNASVLNANGVRANVSTPSGGWLYPIMTYIGGNIWTGTFTVTQNGLYTVRVNATSKAGKVAYAGPTSITGDITVPGITLTSVLPTLSKGLTTITVTNTTADFNAGGVRANVSTPTGGWLYPTMTYTGGNTWIGTFTVAADGLYTVRINATDKAGNNAYAGPTSITGDVTPPGITLTSVLPTPSNGVTTITVTNTTADFNANGVRANVSTPTGSWLYPTMTYTGGNTWTGIFTVTQNGIYTVRVNATDKAGNKAYAGPTSITGDVIPPGITLTSVLPNPSKGLTTITVTNTTADINANGIMVNVSTPSGGWLYPAIIYIGGNTWTGTFTITVDGTYMVRINATDKAGNKAYAGPTSILGDNTPPSSCLITSPLSGQNLSKSVWINATAIDATSGIKNITFYLDAIGGTPIGTDTVGPYAVSWDTTFATNAAHNLYARAFDNVGNYRDSLATNVKVDNIAPWYAALTSPLNGTYVRDTISITGEGADTGGSGLKNITFWLDTISGTPLGLVFTTGASINWDTASVADGPHYFMCKYSIGQGIIVSVLLGSL